MKTPLKRSYYIAKSGQVPPEVTFALHKAEEERVGSSVETAFYLESREITFTLFCAAQAVTEFLSLLKA